MFVVDRIENGYAVVEFNSNFIDIPLSEFKEEVKSGDILYFSVDREESDKVYKSNSDLLNKLFNKEI